MFVIFLVKYVRYRVVSNFHHIVQVLARSQCPGFLKRRTGVVLCWQEALAQIQGLPKDVNPTAQELIEKRYEEFIDLPSADQPKINTVIYELSQRRVKSTEIGILGS